MRILVVEDDQNLNRQLTDTLKEAGYVVDQAFDGEEGHYLGDCEPYDAVILDDLGYVQQSREEMEVLFTFLSDRYEKRTVVITSNLVFSQWDQIFKDPMTTMAAVDRLVHHAIILEFDGASQRAKKPADQEKKSAAR